MSSVEVEKPKSRRGFVIAAIVLLVIGIAAVYGYAITNSPTPAKDAQIELTGPPPKPTHMVTLASVVGKQLPAALATLKRDEKSSEIVGVPNGEANIGPAASLVVTAACAARSAGEHPKLTVYLGVQPGNSAEAESALKSPETFSKNGTQLASSKPGCDLSIAGIAVED